MRYIGKETARPARASDASRTDSEKSEREPVINSLRLIKRVAGTTLGGLAVSAQVSNVLVCLAVIFAGPAFIVGLLGR